MLAFKQLMMIEQRNLKTVNNGLNVNIYSLYNHFRLVHFKGPKNIFCVFKQPYLRAIIAIV